MLGGAAGVLRRQSVCFNTGNVCMLPARWCFLGRTLLTANSQYFPHISNRLLSVEETKYWLWRRNWIFKEAFLLQDILASNVSRRTERMWLAGRYSTRACVIRSELHSVATNTTEIYPEIHRNSQTISPKSVLTSHVSCISNETPD